VRVLFNGVLLRTITLAWNPEKIGAYELVLKEALVRSGLNRLVFVGGRGSEADPEAARRRPDRSFRLW